MKNNSLFKLGGTCSILLGISYTVVGATELLTPPFMNGEPVLVRPIMHWEEYKGLLLANWWALLLGAVFALAVIPAVSKTVLHLDEGWVRWTGTLATLGFAVVILDNYNAIVTTQAIYNAYTTGTDAMRAALTAPGLGQTIDLQGWLAYGAVGAWLLVCSVLALRGRAWPGGLAVLGIIGAGVYFLALAAMVIPGMVVSGAINTVAGIGSVLGPIFYIWLGLFLRRSSSPELSVLHPAEQQV